MVAYLLSNGTNATGDTLAVQFNLEAASLDKGFALAHEPNFMQNLNSTQRDYVIA